MRHAIQGWWIAQEQEFMRSCLALLMMFQAGLTGTASAQDAAVYVVTYVEILPQSMEGAIAVLKADTAAGREDDGCRSMRLLRDVGRDNRFAILAIWKDGDAFAAHSKAQTRSDCAISYVRSRWLRPTSGSISDSGLVQLQRAHHRMPSGS
jgi:quinol monooxygenase YgiN